MATRGRNVIRVAIIGDAKPLGAATAVATGHLAGLGGSAKAMGAAFVKAGAVAAAALGGLALGGGVALFKVGQSFDEAFDTIRVGTGATGAQLDALKGDFREVARSVPSSFGDVGTAIADLNTRTGQTGRGLQDLSVRMLNVSRITNTDLGANIAASTRLFGDWSIASADQGRALDKIFRASQATGIGFTRLQELMVQFGSPLRALGLDFDTATAMFARFEKEGLNIETILPGLKFALGNFAKDGIDPARGLTEAIEGIRNGTLDMSDAVDIFGKRAAPDMFVAIREGRFELDELKDVIANGNDTINDAASDTEDFSEKWRRFRNRILVGLQPLATKVFDAVGVAMDKLPDIAKRVGDAVRRMWEDRIKPALDRLRPLAERVWGLLVSAMREVPGIARAVGEGIVRLGAWLNEHRPVLIGLAAAISGVVVVAFAAWAVSAAAAAVATIAAAAPVIALGAALGLLVAGIIYAWTHFETFRDVVRTVIDVVRGIVEGFITAVTGFWRQFGDDIISFATTAWHNFRQTVEGVVNIVLGVVRAFVALFRGDWRGLWDSVKQIFSGTWDVISAALSNLVNLFRVPLQAVVTAVVDKADTIVHFFRRLPERIGDALRFLANIVTAPFRTALNFIADIWNSTVGGFSFSVPSWVPGVGGRGVTVPEMPHVPAFHDGGIFRSTRGQGLAFLRDGEGVFTPEQMAALGVGTGGTMIVNLPAGSDPTATQRALERWQRRNGRRVR